MLVVEALLRRQRLAITNSLVSQEMQLRTSEFYMLDAICLFTDPHHARIKKAYRRKALELHPDRNLHDVKTATERFAEVQSAHEVLSDPQERAWYDDHRDAILSGQDGAGDGAEPTTFRNVRLTTTEEIMTLMRKFNAAIPFDDEPTGFYGIARETFEHLALEEEAAAEYANIDSPDYPTFGSSDDDYDTVVKPFYNGWSGFSTTKSFSWKDKYRLSDAPDRRVRRLMEKENKKLREDASREFNDAVRFLVTFVRKRDPRYIPNTQSDADRQKSLRDAAAKQAARSRAANNEKVAQYQLPDWVQQDHGEGDFFTDDSAEEDKDIELLECVVCDKTFKSEKQLEAHERSKKHQKAVQQLRRHLRKEGKDLELDHVDKEAFQNSDVNEVGRTDEQSLPSDPDMVNQCGDLEHVTGTDPEDSEVADSVSASLGNLSVAGSGTGDAFTKPEGSVEAPKPSPGIGDKVPPSKKIGKAKLKRERKAAAHAQSANEVRPIIAVCAFHLPALTLRP